MFNYSFTTALVVFLLFSSASYAQQGFTSSGGDQLGTGTASFSIGQTPYLAISSSTDLSAEIQGVQVPAEFFIAYCPEDINRDGLVNVLDFLDLNTSFNTACTPCREDINKDGTVNVLDFLDLNSAFGNICPPLL